MRLFLLPVAVLLLCQPVSAQVWEKIPGTENGIYSIEVNAQNNDAVWFGGRSEIYRSYDKGNSITDTVHIPFETGAITTVFVHPLDTSLIIVGSPNGCHITRDAGTTWNHALPDTNVFLIGDSIALEPGTSDTLYIALFVNQQDSRRTFFRSTDRGESWTSLQPSPDGSLFSICAITAVGENLIFAGRAFGGVYRSTNGGESWSLSYAPSITEFEVPAVVQDKSQPGVIWATILSVTASNGYTGWVVYSESNGEQWTVIPIEGNPWGLDTDSDGNVYAGLFGNGEPGALISHDRGMTWTHIAAEVPSGFDAQVWMLKTSNDDSLLYMADSDIGAYRLDLTSELTSVEQYSTVPTIALPQNYPNPFNPTTTIRFSLTSEQFVSLKIYTLLGQEITELLNKELAAGTYEVPFKADDLPSGTYIYRLRAGDIAQTGRMVLAK